MARGKGGRRAFRTTKKYKLNANEVARKERQVKALTLRLAGASYRAIAEMTGVSHTVAHNDVHSAMAQVESVLYEKAEAVRTMELARLDQLFSAAYRKGIGGDCEAIRTCLRVMERRAKLSGLDKPTRLDIQGDMKSVVDIAVESLNDEKLAVLADLFDEVDAAKEEADADTADDLET